VVCFRYIIVNTPHKVDNKDNNNNINNNSSVYSGNNISVELKKNRIYRTPGCKWKDNIKIDLKQIPSLGVE